MRKRKEKKKLNLAVKNLLLLSFSPQYLHQICF